MNVLVVGSSNIDMIIKVPRLPKPGETVLGGSFITASGGKGANQAVAAARAGGKVTFITKVGNDIFGEKAIQGFESNKIITKYVLKDSKYSTGVAEILVDEQGENCIAVAPGANNNLLPQNILKAEMAFDEADIILVQLEIPIETVSTVVKLAVKRNKRILVNPAPAFAMPDEIFNNIAILTPNKSEAELLTGIEITDEKNAERACGILKDKGVQMVIITLGSKGVYVSTTEFHSILPGFKVNALDTTAAGDIFNGVLATCIADKMMLNDAIHFAQAAAAISVTRLGAQPSCPTRKEILEFIKKQPN